MAYCPIDFRGKLSYNSFEVFFMNYTKDEDFFMTPEGIIYSTAYNDAFTTLFPLLRKLDYELNKEGKAFLGELLKNFSTVLEVQVRRSYRAGFKDGEKSASQNK